MKYLIVQDWASTHGNHAGMVHMCKLLVDKYPNEYEVYVKDTPAAMPVRKNKILRKLLYKYDRAKYIKSQSRLYNEGYMNLCSEMFAKLKPGDQVFLLEYNLDEAPQYYLARHIKDQFPAVKVFALSHLTPSLIKAYGIEKNILLWDKVVDKELTLGSSLSRYFEDLGIPKEKISTGFHYVDSDFYYKDKETIVPTDKLTIITMGALQRDYGMLASIVRRLPNVNWIICRGRRTEVDSYFENCVNVSLKGFLSEDELRYQMSLSDASLNVLQDTVGSNVITTSMAMGLVVIVSDVGSIHDYCDGTNAIFCENSIASFVQNIRMLSSKLESIPDMRMSSIMKSQELRIERINDWFNTLKY